MGSPFVCRSFVSRCFVYVVRTGRKLVVNSEESFPIMQCNFSLQQNGRWSRGNYRGWRGLAGSDATLISSSKFIFTGAHTADLFLLAPNTPFQEEGVSTFSPLFLFKSASKRLIVIILICRFPMEIHFVHHRGDFADVSEALESNDTNALAVLGVFVQVRLITNACQVDVCQVVGNGKRVALKILRKELNDCHKKLSFCLFQAFFVDIQNIRKKKSFRSSRDFSNLKAFESSSQKILYRTENKFMTYFCIQESKEDNPAAERLLPGFNQIQNFEDYARIPGTLHDLTSFLPRDVDQFFR